MAMLGLDEMENQGLVQFRSDEHKETIHSSKKTINHQYI